MEANLEERSEASGPSRSQRRPAALPSGQSAAAGDAPRPRLVEKRVCPFCGTVNDAGSSSCRQCTLEDTSHTRQATRAKLGPWYVLQSRNPASPGMNFTTLLALIEKGRITPRSIMRGPTTQQLWRFAIETKGVSRLFGACWSCGHEVTRTTKICPDCKRMQEPPVNPDALLEPPSPASLTADAPPAGEAAAAGIAAANTTTIMPAAAVPQSSGALESPGATPSASLGDASAPLAIVPPAAPAPLTTARQRLAAVAHKAAAASPAGERGALFINTSGNSRDEAPRSASSRAGVNAVAPGLARAPSRGLAAIDSDYAPVDALYGPLPRPRRIFRKLLVAFVTAAAAAAVLLALNPDLRTYYWAKAVIAYDQITGKPISQELLNAAKAPQANPPRSSASTDYGPQNGYAPWDGKLFGSATAPAASVSPATAPANLPANPAGNPPASPRVKTEDASVSSAIISPANPQPPGAHPTTSSIPGVGIAPLGGVLGGAALPPAMAPATLPAKQNTNAAPPRAMRPDAGDATTLPSAVVPGTAPDNSLSAADQAGQLWSKAYAAERRRDFPAALGYYEAIETLPKDCWPIGLEQRLEAARQRVMQGMR